MKTNRPSTLRLALIFTLAAMSHLMPSRADGIAQPVESFADLRAVTRDGNTNAGWVSEDGLVQAAMFDRGSGKVSTIKMDRPARATGPLTAKPAAAAAPLAPLSDAVSTQAVLTAMKRVADWQLANPSQHKPTDWTQAAGYAGMMALAGISAGSVWNVQQIEGSW